MQMSSTGERRMAHTDASS